MSIFGLFRKKTPTEQRAGIKRSPSIPEDLWNAIWINKKCPDCGSQEFFMGPQGGLCQNVMCANKECGKKFNLAPFEDGTWLDVPFLIDRIDNDPRAY